MGAKAVIINPASITDTFWSLSNSMYAIPPNQFGGPKTPFPPLALLMIGGQLKKDGRYEKVTLIDRNVDAKPLLKNPAVREADHYFINIWSANEKDALDVFSQLYPLGKPIVAGGRGIEDELLAKVPIQYAVRGEAELVFGKFLDDFLNGRAERVYEAGIHTPPEKFLLPDYSLINIKNYVSMLAQFSRGCPFNCEFCNITEDDGKEFRYATNEYVKANLEAILATGFRGHEFVVDDNLIGNPKEALRILKAMSEVENKHGIYLPKYTQMSLNISDKTELMSEVRYWLREARFVRAFLGIESPNNEEALRAAGKMQNLKGKETLKEKLTFASKESGMTFMAGGVFGFDEDSEKTVGPFIDGFNELDIPLEMIGCLTAPQRTRLYERLLKEGRIMEKSSYNNSDGRPNFVPMQMSAREEEGFYVRILEELFSPEAYFNRSNGSLRQANPKPLTKIRSMPESLYSAFKILAGPNNSLYRKQLRDIHEIAHEKYPFMSQGYMYILGEGLTNCAQYTHFQKQVECVKEQAAGRAYEPWQLQSWKEMQAAKNGIIPR
jgi:radical SAM superfamily enzyme YgiQ (UPF0313 family)